LSEFFLTLIAFAGPSKRAAYWLTWMCSRTTGRSACSYAFGFNGEGFAIGPGVGEVMAELLATGATSTPIEPFSIARFAKEPVARQVV